MHMLLRYPFNSFPSITENPAGAVVHRVLNDIEAFSSKVRSGEFKGFSGKKLKNIVAIGIGGSYLGTEFVYEALRHD